MQRSNLGLLTFSWLGLAACSDPDPVPACRTGSECATGICTAQGRCAVLPVDAGDMSDVDAGLGDGGEVDGDGGAPIGCTPNHDGVLLSVEIPRRAGLSANFRAATGASVSLVGTGTGTDRHWDLSGMLANDRDLVLATTPVEGAWYASEFPEATYVARLSITEELLGVFSSTDTELLLLGVVSRDGGAVRTELHYDPPVTLLKFPFQEGDTWSTDSTVSGVALGFITTYLESYTQRVEGRGTLATPYGEFPVVRILTLLERSIPVAAIIRQAGFFAECFGAVATVVSENFETEDEFEQAAEVRRLAR
ncbi:MAG: hypothetical protein HY791_02625 [Deltaproteobacteria bacterium]|nr:hypothetical protein [Deltaproteobacteria bacterium]